MRSLLAIIGVVIAACSSPAPSAPTSPGPAEPAFIYGCGDAADRFTLPALTGPMGAEGGSDDAAAALRTEVERFAPELGLPATGWRRVADAATGVVFLAVGDGDPRWHIVSFERTANGLTLDRMGACDLRVVMDDPDVEAADWWPAQVLDRAVRIGRPIPILVRERACASGQDATGRILPPTIVSAADAVTVVVGVRHRPGGQDCPGNPATPFVLTLPEPLGDRMLLDGSTLPPAQPVPDA